MESQNSQRRATAERFYELFNALPADPGERRNSPAVRELLELCHPDLQFTQPQNQPEGERAFQGEEEFRRAWDDWFSLWELHRSQPELIVERDDRVLVLSREHLVARDGVELDHRGGAILTFRGDRIARIDAFVDQETARRAFEREGAV
jgi:ketosteroid isomerase-like protein